MDTKVFAQILSDDNITDLKMIKYKYPKADLSELITLLKSSVYQTIPLPDFNGHELVWLIHVVHERIKAVKLLLTPQNAAAKYGFKAMEDEIAATMTIENIDFTRDSVRKILKGFAPSDESESRIYGLKKGLEFISERTNGITEENIHTLYQLAIGDNLKNSGDKLLPDHKYRHDNVFVVGLEVEHTGLTVEKIPAYMAKLVDYINTESRMTDLLKAAVIHFYLAYLHPYFDGNGRMARLVHLWYLVQQGYPSALYIPFSSYIEKSRRGYYQAFQLAERNFKIGGVMDVTPFLVYFTESIYGKLEAVAPVPQTRVEFQSALAAGAITEKENALWSFVLSVYGTGEFSTKQLERDFGQAAYATIRSFVLKFEKLGLLKSQSYGNRVKYRI